MPTLTVSLPTDHTTADVGDYNGIISAIIALLNGRLDDDNIAPGALTEASLAADIRFSTFLKLIVPNFNTLPASGGISVPTLSFTTNIGGSTYMINGKLVTTSSTPITVGASKDTYVDVKDDGQVILVPVANNATSGMDLTLNTDGSKAFRAGLIVSDGTHITAVYQYPYWDVMGQPLGLSSPVLPSMQVLAYQGGDSVTNGAVWHKVNVDSLDDVLTGFQVSNGGIKVPKAGRYEVRHVVEITDQTIVGAFDQIAGLNINNDGLPSGRIARVARPYNGQFFAELIRTYRLAPGDIIYGFHWFGNPGNYRYAGGIGQDTGGITVTYLGR